MGERREVFKKMCEGKVKHRDFFPALVAAQLTRKLPGGMGVNPYKCDFCRGWHVGHQPLRNLRKVER